MLFDYKILRAGLTILIAAAAALNAHAHKIHDPTEPMFIMKETAAGQQTIEATPILEQATMPQANLKLQGVMKKKDRTVAIISGQLYALGDQISGYKINEINQDNVVLIGSGTQKRLYVYE
ncbi:MAG: hypothetical protein HWE10_13855 [Gammaproteobacteria bacterium]|nr:hypothetical protein [Gammaproteobacteria bacterium]